MVGYEIDEVKPIYKVTLNVFDLGFIGTRPPETE